MDLDTNQMAFKDSDTFIPRSYQVQIFTAALQRNTIAVVDTGSGKTMIAVMLMKEVGKKIRSEGSNGVIIFLAPTVHLVTQQYEVIKIHTDFKVEVYYGAKGVDEWTAECWDRELHSHEVMVMTPQVLLDALRNAFITLQIVDLMIFDECHHACGNHPYARIMKEFYHNSRQKPKIFGLTASPVIKKGVLSAVDLLDQLSRLQNILDCRICIPQDRNELDLVVPSAKEINWYYDQMRFPYEDFKKKILSLYLKFDALANELRLSHANEFKDIVDGINTVKQDLSRYQAGIIYCLDNLGFICAYEVFQIYLKKYNVPDTTVAWPFLKECFVLCKNFLAEVLQTMKETRQHGFCEAEVSDMRTLDAGCISSKIHELIQIIKSFRKNDEMRCLIFVDRVITAIAIECFMGKLSCLSHFTISHLTGGNSSDDTKTPSEQRNTLNLFRCGKVNILLTTDVSEEGIDVHDCSCVIRFDLPTTVRSYVQSRGRARKNDSLYVLMLERGNIKQRDLIFDIMRSARSMTEIALFENVSSPGLNIHHDDEKDVFIVQSTQASVTASSSISLLHKYCEKLPGDKFFSPRPIFHHEFSDGEYVWTVNLPPNAVFQRMTGPKDKNSQLAKQLACLEACKKLYRLGALDDHLIPQVDDTCKNDLIVSVKETASGAGTTKKKELHGSVVVHALSGKWAEKLQGVTLLAYKLKFSCEQDEYSDFALLIETALDDDVACVSVDLHLADKVVKSSVSPCGKVHLMADQLARAKLFQQVIFNGLFGKLFTGSKVSGKKREFIIRAENRSHWSNLNAYLLLPVTAAAQNILSFDWKAIYSCASVAEYMGSISSSPAKFKVASGTSCCSGSDIIFLADRRVVSSGLNNAVVMAIHTGRIYSVLNILAESSAYVSFESDAGPSCYSSYVDYFTKKYNIELEHPNQPLLLLKQRHSAHNLLSVKAKSERGPAGEKVGHSVANVALKKPPSYIHMPPELLVWTDVSIDILKSLYLLPSLMCRLESLMLACQLRKEIACRCHMPASLILEAITTTRCCEDFSLERLELLGDSVLKYSVSCHLFLRYPEKHEGQLSVCRGQAVCNSALHKLGINRNLQGYIRDCAFEPRRWVAPGQQNLFPVPCKCGVDTGEVPCVSMYEREDNSVVIGKACDRGHRWICSKTVADCVEALIGAYYIGGGLTVALSVMNWLGMEAEINLCLAETALENAARWCVDTKINELEAVERKLGYTFRMKGILLEAITHASQHDFGVDCCYQRLEFLGDAVLDVLITSYLFQNHVDADHGELTDLRSATVNNKHFAQVTVRHRLHHHLQHASGFLLSEITDYVKFVENLNNECCLITQAGNKVPKVLGDMLESIAAAILIDSGINLEKVWEVIKPLLSPFVSPETLELPPFRELIELCDNMGYFVSSKCTNITGAFKAELSIQLEDVQLIRNGEEKSKKAAKAQAACLLLKDLKERGICHVRHASKLLQGRNELVDGPRIREAKEKNDEAHPSKRQKGAELQNLSDLHPFAKCWDGPYDSGFIASVPISVSLAKGSPRSALFNFCKKLQCPLPKYTLIEQRSRLAVEVNDGPDKRSVYIYFTATVALHLPDLGEIEVAGQNCANKGSANDSAAIVMLGELEKRGRCAVIWLH